MHTGGYVVWLKDNAGSFPHFIFSADTDMVTDGLVSLTSTNGKEIFLVKLLPAEYRDFQHGAERAASRVMRKLSRNDIVVVEMAPEAPTARGREHSELLYVRTGGHGNARVIRRESMKSFVSKGGRVHILES